jgi:hypothetical protein
LANHFGARVTAVCNTNNVYPLEDALEAHRFVGTQQKVGNVVLTVR